MTTIIGQERLLEVAAGIISKSPPPYHLLFIAPSGYGKSFIARKVGSVIKKRYNYDYFVTLLTGTAAEEFFSTQKLPGEYKFVLFFDEIHTIKNPEVLYPLFETPHTIIAATNTGELPEPLLNRFIQLPFMEYSKAELKEMFEYYLENKVSDENFERILKASGGVPRRIKELARMWKIFGENIFGTYLSKEGLSNEEIIYIQALKSLGGKSSLSRIKAQTTFSTQYLNRIESSLIQKGIIEITHSGRQLIKGEQND